MGHGLPPFAVAVEAGLRPSLGVDVEVTVRTCSARCARHSRSAGTPRPRTRPRHLEFATTNGARPLGMADRIGSLAPGKQADLVLLRADQPGTAPLYDPYGTVVLGMDFTRVETVLVAGEPVKRNGELRADTTPVVDKAIDVRDRLVTTGNHLKG